jgi:hypothetical protein
MTYEDANIISSTDLPSVAYLWLVCHFGHIPQTSIHVCGICSNSLTDVTNTQQGGYLKTQTHTHTPSWDDNLCQSLSYHDYQCDGNITHYLFTFDACWNVVK